MKQLDKKKKCQRATSGLASVGVSVRGHFSGNLEAHRPSQL